MFEKQLLLTKSLKQNQQTFLGVPPTYADYFMTKYKAVRGRIIRINSWILSWEHRGQKLSFESKRVGNDSTYSYMKQNEKPLTVMDIPSPSVLLF